MRIAYGSCYGNRDLRSDIFKTIGTPDVYIWGGDIVYADQKPRLFRNSKHIARSKKEVIEKYRMASEEYPYYNEM